MCNQVFMPTFNFMPPAMVTGIIGQNAFVWTTMPDMYVLSDATRSLARPMGIGEPPYSPAASLARSVARLGHDVGVEPVIDASLSKFLPNQLEFAKEILIFKRKNSPAAVKESALQLFASGASDISISASEADNELGPTGTQPVKIYTTAILKARLEALPTGEDAPLAVRIMVPVLQFLFKKYREGEWPLSEVELRALKAGSPRDSVPFFDIPTPVIDVIKQLEEIARGEEIFLEVEDFRQYLPHNSLASRAYRFLREQTKYSQSNIVGMVLNFIDAIVSGNVSLRRLGKRHIDMDFQILEALTHGTDVDVALVALEGKVALAERTSRNDLIRDSLIPRAIRMIRDNIGDNHISYHFRDLLNRLWPHMSAEQKNEAFDIVYKYFADRKIESDDESRIEKAFHFLEFMADHAADIPKSIGDRIKDDENFAETMVMSIAPWDPDVYRVRGEYLPAYIRLIGRGRARDCLMSQVSNLRRTHYEAVGAYILSLLQDDKKYS